MKTKNLTMCSLAIALGLGTLTSCGDDDNGTFIPPVGNVESSDNVAADNLVAKWSFENSTVEAKTNNAGTGTNVAYSQGAKGQGWQGSSTEARYAVYNGLTAIGGVSTGFTISFWMNSAGTVANNDTPTQGLGTQGIFTLVKPDEFWGGMNVFLENPSAEFPDRLRLKYLFENKRTGVVWQSYGPIVNIDDMMNEWMHVVLTYDGATGKFSSYINGVAATSVEAAFAPEGGYPGSFIAYANDPGGIDNPNGAPVWGNIDFGGSFSQVVIGAHQFSTTPPLTSATGAQSWATNYAGKLDELRIYNKGLSGAEVGTLYELESEGK